MMKKFGGHILILIGVILIALSTYFIRSSKVESIKAIPSQPVEILPETILPGDPVFLTINTSSKPKTVLWDTKKVSIFHYEGKPRSLVPVDFNEKVLDHKIKVTLENGEVLTKDVRITPRPKIEKPLGIPEKLGGNTPQAAKSLIKNLAAENYVLNMVKTATTTLWSSAFRYPVTNIFVTDEYGYDRNTVNQTIIHKGTDFRAQVGTPVYAMNDGVVKLSRVFTVYGNAIVIDHGFGVQTLYMHMSRRDVKEGDRVTRGQLIGLSGDTGYVEAPHLHISVKINGISIDPAVFLKFF